MADRSVFQAGQADLAVGRLFGQQRQRGALAGVDGAVGLRVAALRRFYQRMDSFLCALVHAGARGVVAEMGVNPVVENLWDSPVAMPAASAASAGLFARFGMNLWDST